MSLNSFSSSFLELAPGKWEELQRLVQKYEDALGPEAVQRIQMEEAMQKVNDLIELTTAAASRQNSTDNVSLSSWGGEVNSTPSQTGSGEGGGNFPWPSEPSTPQRRILKDGDMFADCDGLDVDLTTSKRRRSGGSSPSSETSSKKSRRDKEDEGTTAAQKVKPYKPGPKSRKVPSSGGSEREKERGRISPSREDSPRHIKDNHVAKTSGSKIHRSGSSTSSEKRKEATGVLEDKKRKKTEDDTGRAGRDKPGPKSTKILNSQSHDKHGSGSKKRPSGSPSFEELKEVVDKRRKAEDERKTKTDRGTSSDKREGKSECSSVSSKGGAKESHRHPHPSSRGQNKEGSAGTRGDHHSSSRKEVAKDVTKKAPTDAQQSVKKMTNDRAEEGAGGGGGAQQIPASRCLSYDFSHRRVAHEDSSLYNCQCGFRCHTQKALENHLKVRIAGVVFKCPEQDCIVSYGYIADCDAYNVFRTHCMEAHKIKFTGLEAGCSLCGYVFKTRKELKEHEGKKSCPGMKTLEAAMEIEIEAVAVIPKAPAPEKKKDDDGDDVVEVENMAEVNPEEVCFLEVVPSTKKNENVEVVDLSDSEEPTQNSSEDGEIIEDLAGAAAASTKEIKREPSDGCSNSASLDLLKPPNVVTSPLMTEAQLQLQAEIDKILSQNALPLPLATATRVGHGVEPATVSQDPRVIRKEYCGRPVGISTQNSLPTVEKPGCSKDSDDLWYRKYLRHRHNTNPVVVGKPYEPMNYYQENAATLARKEKEVEANFRKDLPLQRDTAVKRVEPVPNNLILTARGNVYGGKPAGAGKSTMNSSRPVVETARGRRNSDSDWDNWDKPPSHQNTSNRPVVVVGPNAASAAYSGKLNQPRNNNNREAGTGAAAFKRMNTGIDLVPPPPASIAEDYANEVLLLAKGLCQNLAQPTPTPQILSGPKVNPTRNNIQANGRTSTGMRTRAATALLSTPIPAPGPSYPPQLTPDIVEAVKSHHRITDGKNRNCCKCGYIGQFNGIKAHLTAKIFARVFYCPERLSCGAVFGHNSGGGGGGFKAFKVHCLKKHGKDISDESGCDMCGLGFKTKHAMVEHQKMICPNREAVETAMKM